MYVVVGMWLIQIQFSYLNWITADHSVFDAFDALMLCGLYELFLAVFLE